MSAPSVKPLFQAIKPKRQIDPRQSIMDGLPEVDAPATDAPVRDALDFDPTPPDATRAILAEEIAYMRAHGNTVWETAVGAGHIANVLAEHGFTVVGTDVENRGWPFLRKVSFFDCDQPLAPIQFTNPPYNMINARDGHGRWLRHAMSLRPGYLAMLLNADWAAARINGFDDLFVQFPPSVEYLCCWKIDFRGGGAPPQRNCWFVWDTKRPARPDGAWLRKRLFRDGNALQGGFDLGGAA